MKYFVMGALGVMAFSQGAQAVEITGGSVDAGYSVLDDTDFSNAYLTGALEVGFTRTVAVQLDLGVHEFGTASTGRNLAIHSVFHLGETTSLGAFISNDDIDGNDLTYYGVEGGFELPGLDAEVYLATGDDNGSSVNLFGVNLHHATSSDFGITGKIDRASFDSGVDLTRLSVGMDYSITQDSVLYGEIGTLNADAFGLSGSQAYIGIGARMNFGAARGVTFKRRGLLDMMPGL